jgi:hypothetical protein
MPFVLVLVLLVIITTIASAFVFVPLSSLFAP